MLTDHLIETGAIILHNINNNVNNTTKDQWFSGSSYGFYSIPYDQYLTLDHYYYQRCEYKFTTTNQSPAWVRIYLQGGGGVGGAVVNNPVANTEYIISGVYQPVVNNESTPIGYGTIYQGPSNAISGVTGYAKNVLIYDVTDLFYNLTALGIIENNKDALKIWCDANLEWVPRKTEYDVSDKLDTLDKIAFRQGSTVADEFIEADGLQFYSYNDKLRNNTWFDTASSVSIYNNKGNGTVTHSRIDASTVDSPFYPEHKYVLQITTNGEASPGTGGFYAMHMAAADKIFIERFVAKVPVGYSVTSAYNAQGTGSKISYLTSRAGTGDWEEYAILYKCGSSGSFSSGGHVYLTAASGYDSKNVTWYLAYVNNCDITEKPELQDYSVLRKKTSIKKGTLSTYKLDETNLFTNGDLSDSDWAGFPIGWQLDYTDKAGNGFGSLVQPVGAARNPIKYSFQINPFARYKISYWVKCKGDMTSYLTAIQYLTSGGTELTHTNVVFVPNTKTTLAADLNTGDTQVTLTSSANWVVKNYSKLGFRSGSTWSMCAYNDLGTANGPTSGIVKSISGNVITLSTAYTGATKKAGTVVVESYDGGTYPYPISKTMLPTNNEWKYVEGYFGSDNVVWEGASSSGWAGIPAAARKCNLYLNLYSNTGTVPIKYSDIRIEEVGINSGHRRENKIEFKRENH